MVNFSGLTCVFVHLGSPAPEYLFANLCRFRDLFPEETLLFISDSSVSLDRARSLGVNTYQYSREAGSLQMPKLSAGFEFRNGFWHYTLERLYAIAEWHSLNPAAALLHIESDLVLMPDFPFSNFLKVGKCAWPRVNESTDMAGLLFSPGGLQTEWLISKVTDEVLQNPSLNDMTVLSRISNGNPEKVAMLPTWSKSWADNKVSSEYSNLEHIFGGIFDAASLGTWLTGQDPRNHWGLIRRFDVFSDYILDFHGFRFTMDPRGRFMGTRGSANARIFNLHVHSKELKYFETRCWKKSVMNATLRSEKSVIKHSFQFRGFVYVLSGYLKILFSDRGLSAVTSQLAKLISRNSNV